MMTQKEKLIELLSERHSGSYEEAQRIADYLLDNGVVVLPCSVGGKAFLNTADSCVPLLCTVQGVYFTTRGDYVRLYPICQPKNWLGNQSYIYKPSLSSFGKTIFLTREEAEAVLRDRRKDHD